MKKTVVTKAELDASQELSEFILLLATAQPPHVGLGAIIMAAAVGAASLKIPLENFLAMMDKTTTDVYALKAKSEAQQG